MRRFAWFGIDPVSESCTAGCVQLKLPAPNSQEGLKELVHGRILWQRHVDAATIILRGYPEALSLSCTWRHWQLAQKRREFTVYKPRPAQIALPRSLLHTTTSSLPHHDAQPTLFLPPIAQHYTMQLHFGLYLSWTGLISWASSDSPSHTVNSLLLLLPLLLLLLLQ